MCDQQGGGRFPSLQECRRASTTESVSNKPDGETTSGCSERETTSECFWPTILGHIRAPQAGIKAVVCAICHDSELVIPGLQPLTSDNFEDAVLLACGHVLGKDCVKNWKDNCMAGRKHTWSCPICRADLSPRRCKKHRDIVDLTRLDETSEVFRNYQSRMEANEEVSRQCRDCQRYLLRLRPTPRSEVEIETLVTLRNIRVTYQGLLSGLLSTPPQNHELGRERYNLLTQYFMDHEQHLPGVRPPWIYWGSLFPRDLTVRRPPTPLSEVEIEAIREIYTLLLSRLAAVPLRSRSLRASRYIRARRYFEAHKQRLSGLNPPSLILGLVRAEILASVREHEALEAGLAMNGSGANSGPGTEEHDERSTY
ncbi:hypothetical protein V8F06_008291 [Rhypophila decipiens]